MLKMRPPTPEETARHIITHPADFEAELAVRAAAWASMKQARGQTADLDSMANILLETHRAPVTARAIALVRQSIEGALDTDRLHSVLQRIRVTQRIEAHTGTRKQVTARATSTLAFDPFSPSGGGAA